MLLHSVIFALLFVAVFTAVWATARALVDARLTKRNLFVLFMHKGGLGDAFCQTGLMRAIRAKHPGVRFIIFTKYPEFFWYLPDVASLVDMKPVPWLRVKMLNGTLRLLRLNRAHDFVYKPQRQTPKAKLDANPGWRPHLVELASEKLRVPADFSDVRGLFRFSQTEQKEFSEKYGSYGDYAVIVPAGKTSYTPNKEWGFDNYAAVAAATPDIKWVQLGIEENPRLAGATDLRGKTSLREMAWVLYHAKFALCGEGLHNHLCGALGTKCFVVFSGFHYPEIAKYPATIPILAPKMPQCAPCFLKTPCPTPGKPCTNGITPAQVVAALRSR